MPHPWILLATTLKDQGRTQKQFAILAWKKVSEVNELIKGKRNITIQWDYILYTIFDTPLKHRLQMQVDYDYEQFLATVSTPSLPYDTETPEVNPSHLISSDWLNTNLKWNERKKEEENSISKQERKEKENIFRDF
jgi:plasmid maintenance system antidote protein VapI